MKTQRVPFGFLNHPKKNGVFLAIYVESISPWKYFKDDMQHIKCPALIMIDRWDGRMGFPGGTVNEGEHLMEALVREIKEEIGITIKPDHVHPIASHENHIVTHLYGLKVLEAEFLHIYYHILNNFSRSILLHAYEEGDKSHFMSEITGIKIVPLIHHDNKGINRFLENSFAGATREDLDVLLREILDIKLD
ncbi:NUDIX hydrolase [Sulfuricurvum sp.]|uniref:NUDIX domain-containing protein n=1 Tax=Sulfuricurvum sp. TaxID=2025608 RepID=UPI0019932065|nr:NUDIX hydrolase [Sulfuricurvum sp.]MBD3799137.1 NUDIX hydrolase [Campylobacterota bacterium]MBD3806599.1 NUDIX hydrolase [Sulfuricurvum sp.]